jgi:23S rRNA pseudouridine2457 synthase
MPDLESGRKIRDARHGPTGWITITVTEGKFRQVRKMTAAVGFPTLRLVRVRVGDVRLGNLKAGQVLEVEHFNTP